MESYDLRWVKILLTLLNAHARRDKENISTSDVIAAVLVLSGYSVALAGHYGAQLVHLEGIGPQGKYLERGHHH
jgi:hypothetical protein